MQLDLGIDYRWEPTTENDEEDFSRFETTTYLSTSITTETAGLRLDLKQVATSSDCIGQP